MIYHKINVRSWCNWQRLLSSLRWAVPWKGSLSRVSAEVHRVVWAEDLEEPPLQKTDNKICKRLMIKIKISADSDCSQQIKRCLLLGRKAMINLDSILKSRGITLPTKSPKSKLWFLQWSCMDVRIRLWRKLSTEELMLLNCGVGEDSWESLGWKEIKPLD